MHLYDKNDRLNRYGKQTGLNMNTEKTQVTCFNTAPSSLITFDGKPLEFVENFAYLGSIISKDNEAQKDINKINTRKARCAFVKLQTVWKSKNTA